MNYKSLIKNQSLRRRILRMLSFIPDKPMIKLQYRLKMGRKLDLNNPKRFTEKIQWYKLYYKNPLMIQCVDKYDVREYVKSKGLGEILIPCYGVFDSADDIEWKSLPNQFVMKDTLGGGGNSVIIVKDKTKEDIAELKRRAKEWTKIYAHVKSDGREWPYYSGKKHRIIIEKYIEPEKSDEETAATCVEHKEKHGLIDYKFFCFNGRSEFLYVMGDRQVGEKVSVGIYDKDYKKLPVLRLGDDDLGLIEKPKNFELMKSIAEQLAKEFLHVRVDLYSVGDNVLFGELTFYNASGYMVYDPDDFDYTVGNYFKIH
ncbi:MAG: carbonic anhydrase [Eubacterium sp.]|nr:carbonic anhydrase [Eubacterium sp.]